MTLIKYTVLVVYEIHTSFDDIKVIKRKLNESEAYFKYVYTNLTENYNFFGLTFLYKKIKISV